MESESKGPRRKGEEVKLKPCPFCGSSVRGESILLKHKPMYQVGCWAAGCLLNPTTDYESSEQEAIAAWNQRPAKQPVWEYVGECEGDFFAEPGIDMAISLSGVCGGGGGSFKPDGCEVGKRYKITIREEG